MNIRIYLSEIEVPVKYKVQYRLIHGEDYISVPDIFMGHSEKFYKIIIKSFLKKEYIHVLSSTIVIKDLRMSLLIHECGIYENAITLLNIFMLFGVSREDIYIKNYPFDFFMKSKRTTIKYEQKKHFNKK